MNVCLTRRSFAGIFLTFKPPLPFVIRAVWVINYLKITFNHQTTGNFMARPLPHIFKGSLSVMAWLAHWLPVQFIPEQNLIAFMRNDMVNNCGSCDLVTPHTLSTQRMPSKKYFTGPTPRAVISPLIATATVLIVLLPILLVVSTVALVYAIGLTARMATWPWR